MTSRKFLNFLLVLMIMVLLWATQQTALKKAPDSETALFDTAGLNSTTLSQLRLEHPHRADITLRNINNQWWLETPLNMRANDAQVQALGSITTATSRSGFRATGNDLSQYGLAPPAATLWLNEQLLEIGMLEALSGRRYVRLGDQVHLIEDHWSDALFAGAHEYISPHLLPEGAKLIRVQLPNAHWNYQQGQWREHSATPSSGEPHGAELAAAWSKAKALLVQPFNPKLPWQGELRIEIDGQSESLDFKFAETATGWYFARSKFALQYLLSSSRGAVLLGRSHP